MYHLSKKKRVNRIKFKYVSSLLSIIVHKENLSSGVNDTIIEFRIDKLTLMSCQYFSMPYGARFSRDKMLSRHFIESKEFVLWRHIHRTSSTEERELLVSSPRKSVETQAHLSASNIDRARLLQVPLSPPVAFLPLPLSTRFVPPPYIPLSFQCTISESKQKASRHFSRITVSYND
jgi:hypothetical protein